MREVDTVKTAASLKMDGSFMNSCDHNKEVHTKKSKNVMRISYHEMTKTTPRRTCRGAFDPRFWVW